MKQTFFYLVCLLAAVSLIAGCSALPSLKPAQPAQPTTTTAVPATKPAGPTFTATISTPSVVTVGAPATAVPTATITPKPSKTPQPSATPKYVPVVKAANFVKTIDNPYFPLTPGTTFLYSGTEDGAQVINTVVVSKKTRKIMGVLCIEVDDTVTLNDKLAEKTLDWYAQDKQGNVWYFGEDSKEYNTSGKVTSTAGSWIAGVNGALPGILMQANPTADQPYRQEYLKGHAEDMAQVLSLTESLKVTYGSYDSVLLIKEWTPLEAKVVENKWYAKGVGLIASKTIQGGTEDLQLTSVTK